MQLQARTRGCHIAVRHSDRSVVRRIPVYECSQQCLRHNHDHKGVVVCVSMPPLVLRDAWVLSNSACVDSTEKLHRKGSHHFHTHTHTLLLRLQSCDAFGCINWTDRLCLAGAGYEGVAFAVASANLH